MQLAIPTAIAVLATTLIVSPTSGDAPAMPEIGITATDVVLADGSMGCDINITARNTGSQNLKFETSSQVRAKPKISPTYGTWKRLWSSAQTVPARQTSWSRAVRLDLGCNLKRQYRFTVTYGGNSRAFNYPSTGGTTSKTLSMGDLYTKFFD